MSETKTIRDIDERIAHVSMRITDMYQSIGKAYESGDEAGISYYEMHLKAWQSELAELEVEREARHQTVEERCKELMRNRYARAIEAQKRRFELRNRPGESEQRVRSAETRATEEYRKYDNCLEFAAELLGVSVGEFDREVCESAIGA